VPDRDERAKRWAPTLSAQQVEELFHGFRQLHADASIGGDVVTDPEPDEPANPYAHTGVMVAFFPTPDQANELAVDGGEPPEELHLTLAFLGTVGKEIDPDAESKLIDAVTAWAKEQGPISATVNGLGLFTTGPAPVTYANIDAPALPGARQDLIETLEDAGFPANGEHGYTPHMTLIYADARDLNPPPVALNFTDVVLAFAGNRTTIALGTPEAEASQFVEQVKARAKEFAAQLTVTDRMSKPPAPPTEWPLEEEPPARAFVADINGRTLITGPATAAMKDLTVEDIADKHLLWMHGKFVGAEVPNRNGALWSAGDLSMARASVVNGPLNWLHEARHVIGTLARADYVEHQSTNADDGTLANGTTQPHITADAAIWRWIWPDEAYVVQQASDQGALWYSMECISKEVACAGPNGCGNSTTYAQYMSGMACEHVTQRASVRQFVNPVFLGGAVIVPPTRPGWAEADARVMATASKLAEAAFEQAGAPDVSTSEWEQLMGQLVRFAST
jgi:2'-5' RNA ligase